jgi:hypothetical protein
MELTTPTLASLHLKDKEDEAAEDSIFFAPPKTEREYSFSLWLPEEAQKKPPEPTNVDVEVIDYPEITVYVRAFGGFATEGEGNTCQLAAACFLFHCLSCCFSWPYVLGCNI